MSNDHRVPAGVPTGGEFATGAKAENDDLQTPAIIDDEIAEDRLCVDYPRSEVEAAMAEYELTAPSLATHGWSESDLDAVREKLGAPGTYEGKTAREWLAEAADSSRLSQESFERSDTDGYLTQWANDLGALERKRKANLARNRGITVTQALFDLDGNVISTHHGFSEGFAGRSRPYWVLNDEAAAKFGTRFVNPSGATKPETERANNRKKGFTIGMVKVKGRVNMVGGDMLSVRPMIQPDLDAVKAGEYEVLTPEYIEPEERGSDSSDPIARGDFW